MVPLRSRLGHTYPRNGRSARGLKVVGNAKEGKYFAPLQLENRCAMDAEAVAPNASARSSTMKQHHRLGISTRECVGWRHWSRN